MDRDPFAPTRYLSWGRRRLRAMLALEGVVARSPRASRIDYLPGRALTITWTAELTSGGGQTALGQVIQHSGARPLAGVDPVGHDDWGHPIYVFPAVDDPALPGLARALDPSRLSAALAGMGIRSLPDGMTTRIVKHDPMRRAVVEVRAPGGGHVLEVLAPARAANVHLRHELLAAEVSVPLCDGLTDDGILVLRPIRGDSLRTTLLEGYLFPPLRSIVELLDRMPRTLVDQIGAVGTLERIGGHVEVLAAVLPDRAARLQELSVALGPFADRDPGPLVAHHGDLRPSILMVSMGQLVGLTDTAGVGEGYRIDDLASLIGHLSLLGWLHRSVRCEHLATCWLDEVERGGDHLPSALRARIAAVMLGSAVGCFRRQDTDWRNGARHRITLAERWLDRAHEAARAERTLLVTRPDRGYD